MQYRTVTKTGEQVPVLGYGCMRFPEKNGKIDEEKSTFLLRYAIDNGVTYLDTAWVYHYGQSEPFLGRALSGGYREKVKLATKLPQWLVKTRKDMDTFLNAQLSRLNTNRIDYYLIHSVGRDSWEYLKEIGVLDFLEKAKLEGKIINAGFSFHEDTRSFCRIVDDYPWEFCLIQYNILDEYSQAGRTGLAYAAEKGLAVFVMEPLRGGKLARNPPVEIRGIWDGAPVQRSPAEWALRWLWDQPEVTMVLSGMNELAQISENIAVAEATLPGSLTETERNIISRVSKTYRTLMKVPCTGCQYCMPCPYGVNIPSCFEIYNEVMMFGDTLYARIYAKGRYAFRVGGLSGRLSAASVCRNCGTCLSSCPQHIVIPDRLREVSNHFEGLFYYLAIHGGKIGLLLHRYLQLLRNRLS
ncbi:MAG: aldo/keto reductase [Methanospirillum sp.]|nr:aldo/keto reductase [Methanospirillum sp.]